MTTVETRDRDRGQLVVETAGLLETDHRVALVACHEEGNIFRIVYVFAPRRGDLVVEVVVRVPCDDAWVPSVAELSPPAGLFEREMYDLYGVRPDGHPQPYRLLRHAHWPQGWHPMLSDAGPKPPFDRDVEAYPFLQVEGTGVYEIAVGPIHAGIIEPGHFRFSVIGETIVRLEPRLWFLHRGIEKLFEGKRPADAIALAEQISGDTSVGHSLAFVMAVEAAAGIDVPEPARHARALLLELERLYNHVTDIGALANDAGFGIANMHAQRLREQLMRINLATAGHRLLRGCISIGGATVLSLPDPAVLADIAAQLDGIEKITIDHSIVRDRFTGTSVLPTGQAFILGTLGFVARASGIDIDARRDLPFVDLGGALTVVVEPGGDVLARYRVRAREVVVSVAICGELIRRLGAVPGGGLGGDAEGAAELGGDHGRDATSALESKAAGHGLSFVEAWRGTIAHRVELAADGTLARVKIVDPSFVNWPSLPIALADTIVPDFPLANKSFNQSYAANDL